MVILNGQYSSWAKTEAGVFQGLILGSLLFLIFIDHYSKTLMSNTYLFPSDTSLISVDKNTDASIIDLNKNLKSKMNFEPDPTKQAYELVFSK